MNFSLLTPANLLTLIRALSVPILGYCIVGHHWAIAIVLFSVAIITDFFDGIIARILKQQSMFGALFDHITDKVLVTVVISSLLITHLHLLPPWFCVLSLTREFLIALVSGALFISGRLTAIKPLRMSNIIMATQTLMLWWLIAAQAYRIPFYKQSIAIVAGCIGVNMIIHIIAGIKLITKS